jgi:hypothetical protein
VGRDVTDPEQVINKLSKYADQLADFNLFESELRVIRTEILAFRKVSKVSSDQTLTAIYNLSIMLSRMSRYQEAEIFAREMLRRKR